MYIFVSRLFFLFLCCHQFWDNSSGGELFSSLGSILGKAFKGFLFLQSPVTDSMKGSGQKPSSSLLSPSLLPEEENEGFEPTVKRLAI